jgi:TnpA family transposase
LAATVAHLEVLAVDDALELFDLLMVSNLLARAIKESDKEKLRRVVRLDRASVTLAAGMGVLLDTSVVAANGEAGPTLADVWERIEAVASRAELAAAVATVVEAAPPVDADEEWRAELVGRFATVRPFLSRLTDVIAFGALAEGAPVLAALRTLPDVLRRGSRARPVDLDAAVVTGSWHRLVFGARHGEPDAVNAKAYALCVLEQFHRQLRRRDIYAHRSSRWGDPRAKLLDGAAWEESKPTVLRALKLPEDPDELLATHAAVLDATYRQVAERLPANAAVSFDEEGRLHLAALKAEADPPSLVDLRERLWAMLPQVDLPEVILEVMAWVPAFPAAFASLSSGEARLVDLHVTIAAVLTAHALNIGYAPIAKPGVPALSRDRLSHVDQNYLRPETYRAANTPLVTAQTAIELAQSWGGGFVASVDGLRFVVPVATIHARPNPRYFGRGRGATWLNAVNDQAAGIAGLVVSGTPRDSLHLIDVLYRQAGGPTPDVVITDTASYSDIVFGLLHLLGRQYRPQLADLPDQKLWRIDPAADYGPFNPVARGKVNLTRIRRHWPDIVRVAASIHTGSVRAYDVIRMLQRDGNPTPLGHAIAHYGRVFKSTHVLTYVDDPPYRRGIKAQSNLQEDRHSLARRLFHGSRGELRQRYHDGMEDQLGALGLVLNCVTLWNTFYMNTALGQLRAQGYPVRDEDLGRLSPFARKHVNVQGHYSFALPAFPGGRRPLRDPDDRTGEED